MRCIPTPNSTSIRTRPQYRCQASFTHPTGIPKRRAVSYCGTSSSRRRRDASKKKKNINKLPRRFHVCYAIDIESSTLIGEAMSNPNQCAERRVLSEAEFEPGRKYELVVGQLRWRGHPHTGSYEVARSEPCAGCTEALRKLASARITWSTAKGQTLSCPTSELDIAGRLITAADRRNQLLFGCESIR